MKRDYLDSLIHFIECSYDIRIISISEAKRGFFGETWRIECTDDIYFCKIDYWKYHKKRYHDSLEVIEFLIKKDIKFIPPIIKTVSGNLFCVYNDGVLALFPFIEGENTEDYPIINLFKKLVDVYMLNTDNLHIERETFGIEIIEVFTDLLAEVSHDHLYNEDVSSSIDSRVDLIRYYVSRLIEFSKKCKSFEIIFHLTHGDPGGNCIINGEQFTIVDWDHVKLAPIERDTWYFMHDKKQLKDIENALKNGGLDYELNYNLYCYYCYYSFFYYMTEHLSAYLESTTQMQFEKHAKSIEGLFFAWFNEQIMYANTF